RKKRINRRGRRETQRRQKKIALLSSLRFSAPSAVNSFFPNVLTANRPDVERRDAERQRMEVCVPQSVTFHLRRQSLVVGELQNAGRQIVVGLVGAARHELPDPR